jgi:hypothetical protein
MEATIGEDGLLHTRLPMPPALVPGVRAMISISPVLEQAQSERQSLTGTVLRYDDPFGPAAPLDEWEALQ